MIINKSHKPPFPRGGNDFGWTPNTIMDEGELVYMTVRGSRPNVVWPEQDKKETSTLEKRWGYKYFIYVKFK